MRKVSGHLAKEIQDLSRMRDEDIDLTDIPETADWSKAVVGKLLGEPIHTIAKRPT